MKTLSETTVVPAADEKEEPKPHLTVPSGKKVSKKKIPNTVTKKLAPKKARKAARKAKKPAAKKAVQRREFPYQRVLKLWKEGKTMEVIARAVGRYQKNAADPLHGFRVSLTRFHKGVKLNGRLVKLSHRVSKSSLKLSRKAGRRAAQ